jgi:glutamate synthase (ferredoxin)
LWTPRKARIIGDAELKEKLATANPYQEWLESQVVRLRDLEKAPAPAPEATPLLKRQQAFGYSQEDLTVLMAPMARDGVEPLGSMGTDTPLAVLSESQHLLYDYFKQLFAQVTNPPLTRPVRSWSRRTETLLGAEGNCCSRARGVAGRSRCRTRS